MMAPKPRQKLVPVRSKKRFEELLKTRSSPRFRSTSSAPNNLSRTGSELQVVDDVNNDSSVIIEPTKEKKKVFLYCSAH
jgi:hypothetical protein